MLNIKIGSTENNKIISHPMKFANRHGLIAGATGTGKTTTLQTLIENFSDNGVAVFAVDVKGDLSGIAQKSSPTGKILDRINTMSWLNYNPKAYPLIPWDMYGKTGHFLRVTISQIGPLLLSNILELTDTQQAILNIVFQYADTEGLLLLDYKDLKSTLNYIKDNPEALKENQSLFSSQSASALLRKLTNLEAQGANIFFGEPSLDIQDLIKINNRDNNENGIINILDATKLINESPKIYATFLLWLLSEIFETLPERGDLEKPLMVLFFDEAHLLFNGTSKVLQDKIEQVVRLIRSKGVGIYFVTQSPKDIPDAILSQLSLKIQHALRAFTEKEQKALKAVSQSFRNNPKINTLNTLTNLGIGEALVGVLDEKGSPLPVEKVFIAPPQSRLGPITNDERLNIVNKSPLKTKYNQIIDIESAYEILNRQMTNNTQLEKNFDKNKKDKGLTEQIVTQIGKNIQRKATNKISTMIVKLLGNIFGGKK